MVAVNGKINRTSAAGQEVRSASRSSQIPSLIDCSKIAAAVQRTSAEKRTRDCRCWDQFASQSATLPNGALAQGRLLRRARRHGDRRATPLRHFWFESDEVFIQNPAAI